MALIDYRLCDVCGEHTFYDADLNYEFDQFGDPLSDAELRKIRCAEKKSGIQPVPATCGAWRVICIVCAETHEIVIVPKKDQPHE